jgi:hypothetical protein
MGLCKKYIYFWVYRGCVILVLYHDVVILSDLFNGIKKRLREISCHKHFNDTYASCGFLLRIFQYFSALSLTSLIN